MTAQESGPESGTEIGTESFAPGSSTFTMYSTTWCGYCHRLKGQLSREGIEFAEVDIERDPAAAEIVMAANGGNQTVPTLVYADGTAQTNPSLAQVKAKLAAPPA